MKKILAISGLLLVIAVIMAGAVFGLPRLFTSTVSAQETKPEQIIVIAIEEVKNGESFGGEVRISFSDPTELPDRVEDTSGLFLSKDGQELSLGTGAIEVDVSVEIINDQEPKRVVNTSYDGGEVHLMVDENTIYYRDATVRPEITREILEAGQLQLTRVLETGSIDELGENMMVRAWGEIKDGRLLADLIVYDPIE
jgi:hypothetical protein